MIFSDLGNVDLGKEIAIIVNTEKKEGKLPEIISRGLLKVKAYLELDMEPGTVDCRRGAP